MVNNEKMNSHESLPLGKAGIKEEGRDGQRAASMVYGPFNRNCNLGPAGVSSYISRLLNRIPPETCRC